jgi:hypothetical protein
MRAYCGHTRHGVDDRVATHMDLHEGLNRQCTHNPQVFFAPPTAAHVYFRVSYIAWVRCEPPLAHLGSLPNE